MERESNLYPTYEQGSAKGEGLSEEEQQQFMDTMSRNLGNVQAMLTSLMDLSRLEACQQA